MRKNAYKGILRLLAVTVAVFTLLTGCSAPRPSYNVPITLDNIPPFAGEPYVVINDNQPYFTEDEITRTSYESYSPMDHLGRCGVAVASIGIDIMPTEDRGNIGSVKPSGWQSVKYDIVDGKYLYNRCHLIAFMLAGENANEENLITGTRFMNTQGMLSFEDMVHDYVIETENHVMYRVSPIFDGNNLVASGCLMEAYSVEDNGDGICFCIYVYNAQPGITINYADGTSCLNGQTLPSSTPSTAVGETYVLNTSSKRVHKSTCSQVGRIDEENKAEITGTLEDIIADGYTPCGTCFKDEALPSATPVVTPAPTATPVVTPAPTPEDGITADYVLNTSSKRVHKSSCSQVDRINEENRAEYYGELADIIAQGYIPCGTCFKDEDLPSATPTVTPIVTPTPAPDSGTTYVLNTDSMKFHYPSCYQADRIKEENKATSTSSRQELIASGYSACGVCKP